MNIKIWREVLDELRNMTPAEYEKLWRCTFPVVAAPTGGAGEINSPQLSDNGPAHQIAVLPLAGSPSDNTSQPESVMPCVDAPACHFEGTKVCQRCHNQDEFYPA